jgi:IS5 family transposase
MTKPLEATRRIVDQSRQRLAGTTPDGATRRVSLHDPDARPIRKGRLGKPVEFGHKAQVCDNQDQGDQAVAQDPELIVYVLSVLGVLSASWVVDVNEDGQRFSAYQGWFLVTLLTIGYLISRGLAKSGSRDETR